MDLVHRGNRTSIVTVFSEYRDAIIAEVDGVALRVGRLLREAKALDPGYFPRWVDEELPFGNETARRLMAISAAYEKLPVEVLRGLPRPWQALYALKELPAEMLIRAVQEGELAPQMTVEQAKRYARTKRGNMALIYKRANQTAGRLLRCSPHDLRPVVREALRTWLDQV